MVHRLNGCKILFSYNLEALFCYRIVKTLMCRSKYYVYWGVGDWTSCVKKGLLISLKLPCK